MTGCCLPGCDGPADLEPGSAPVCLEHYEKHYAPSEAGPGAKGAAFARELLFIKWRHDDSYYGATTAWVADCPDGVDPRSEENPAVYTWRETLGSDWGDGPGEEWYIVGARGDRWWVGAELDVSDGHEERIDFDPVDLRVPTDGCLLALSKSGGPHAYVLSDEEPPALATDYDGVDLMGDSPNVRQMGAVSPWHDDRRAVLSDPEPEDKSHLLDGRLDELFTVRGRDEPILVEDEGRSAGAVEIDIPDESPDDAPYCISQLAAVRTSELRNEYGGSPFEADSHLGMMLLANGYSVDEATAFLRDHPPAKSTGFDEDETRYQLGMLEPKLRSGELAPPMSVLTKNGINIQRCGCSVHGSGREGGCTIPEWEGGGGPSRRDDVLLEEARSDVRRTLKQPISGGMIYHAPQGLGKTRFAAHGAGEQPRLVITVNKGEHRDTLEWAAGEEGVEVDEVTPFGESWLCSDASPVADECMELYSQGVMPKYILAEYSDLVPEDAECPYLEQFEGAPPEADLLMGSPGHENVARFRRMGDPDADDPEEDAVPRAVVYDDVNPADREINENTFTLDGARAGLNELLQEIPQIGSDSVAQLLQDRGDRELVERIALGDGRDDGAGDEPVVDDVWSALDAAASEDDAIRVDIVDVVRRRENVRGDTIIKLKVVAGAEIRGVRAFSWRKDDTEYFSWVSHPDLTDHDVAVLSATHVPHVTEEWFEHANAGPVAHRTATDDWKAVRRAQGYELMQTRRARNSRSGAGAYAENPEDRRATMRDRRDDIRDAIERREGREPGVIDTKRLLDGDEGINFARTWSNNEYKDRYVGLVAGTTYYGDDWVEARAAYCGETILVEHPGPGERARCDSEVGADLLEFMTRAEVEQAVTRFGRASDDRTVRVYLDTDEVPQGFPARDISDEIRYTTDTQRDVYEAIGNGAETIEAIASRVAVGRRQVSNVLWELEDMGLVTIERRALGHGKHKVALSGNGPISINKVELPEIGREGGSRVPEDSESPREDDESLPDGVQLTFEPFSGPPG